MKERRIIMKALFIGGTGIISTEVSKLFVKNGGELYLLNRGNRNHELSDDVHFLIGDADQEEQTARLLEGMTFDVVADFRAFTPDQVERDYRLFCGKTKQFIFISSTAAYQRPVRAVPTNESTPQDNPYWQYARDKITGEEILMKHYRENNFPVTIVRPGHTYSKTAPLVDNWTVLTRMMQGKPTVIQGDGTTFWSPMHSSDFAKAFVGLMGNVHALGQAVQITSDEVLTWNQIYEIIADLLGVELHPFHVASDFLAQTNEEITGAYIGDKSNSVIFDNTKIKRLVPDFVCTKPFAVGYRDSVEYYLSHPELHSIDQAYDRWCDAVIKAQQDAAEAVKRELA